MMHELRTYFKYLVLLLFLWTAFTGCSSKKKIRTPAPTAGTSTEKGTPSPIVATDQMQGIASWYGHPYHGRRTASGDVYDMYGLTAAHNTLPFESNVLVHNLDTQKSVLVRINDRGPFVDGRIIDLSLTAARKIDMVGPGTARVRLTLQPTHTQPEGKSPQYTVQVGFFQEKQNAVRLRKELSSRYQSVAMTTASDGGFRVQIGAQKTRTDAEMVRQRLAEDGIKGFVRLLEK